MFSLSWTAFRRNPLPKILSFIAAVTLWYLNTAEQRRDVEQSYTVSISIHDTSSGDSQRTATELKPSQIHVVLSGRPERLRRLRSSEITASVDITDLPEGGFNRPIHIQIPARTRLVSRSADRIQGTINEQVSRRLEITSTQKDGEYRLIPQFVTIKGSHRAVRQVVHVVAVPTPLRSGETREVNLLALDEHDEVVDNIQLSPPRVRVYRNISPMLIE